MMRSAPPSGGFLEVVCGPMFSGKSEELMRRVRRSEIAGLRVAIFKPAIDDRFDASDVVSHAGGRMQAWPVRSAKELRERVGRSQVIGIDEAQFFDADLIDTVRGLVVAGRRVIVAGLDCDYRGLPFGPMPTFLAVAEFVDKLQAVCHRCGGAATMTQRLVNGAPAPFDGATIVVGAAEQYEARCRSCHRVDDTRVQLWEPEREGADHRLWV
jgi:thymidine kinase